MIPRGTVVITAIPGDYGKPRPAIVVQSSHFEGLPSSVVCPLTSFEDGSDFLGLRPVVQPSEHNALERPSRVMVDKLIAMPNYKLVRQVGSVDAGAMAAIDTALTPLLGLA